MSPKFADMIYAPRDLAVSLADGLVYRGHEVTFATAPDIQTRASILPGDTAFLSLMHRSPESHALIKRDYEIDLLTRTYKHAQEVRFDIIHVYTMTMAHYFEQFVSCPVVYTLHDPLPTEQTLGRLIIEKYKHHHFIAISNSQTRTDIPRMKIDTVYHGLDATKYPVNMAPDKRYVFMGRMVPEKGLEDAIKACVVTNTKLLAASDWLEHSALDNPLVETVGVVDQVSRARLLGNARALLFPIKWEEPFGMVMIEAMACGTPVVAYNRGSVPEIVKDGVTGYIVPPEAGVEGLVAAMKKISQIDRAACRKHVEENFSVEKMVEGYLRVYQNAIHTSS